MMASSVYIVTGELTNDDTNKNDCDNIFLASKNILLYSVLAMHVFSAFTITENLMVKGLNYSTLVTIVATLW